VDQRDLVQWFFRITAYAQELLDGLDKLDGWPEKVRTMQRNWIGRSEGTDVDFFLDEPGPEKTRIRVFTTRVDTIFGATSVQLAPQHELVAAFTAADPKLKTQVDELLEQQKRAREAGDPGCATRGLEGGAGDGDAGAARAGRDSRSPRSYRHGHGR